MARLYWMKLKRDFFKRHDIQVIEAMPNGKDYVLFYLKLLCESLDHEGNLRFSDTIPYNEEMLSAITHTNVDTVRSAMNLFISLGLVEIFDDKTIYMSEVQKFIGSESESAERMRRHRALKSAGASQCDGDVTESDKNVTQSIDNRDKSIEYREERKKENKEIKTTSAGAREDEPLESYDSLMTRWKVGPQLRAALWQFIQHCSFNGRALTNAKLEDIIDRLIDFYGYSEIEEGKFDNKIDKEQADEVRRAINGGYFDIKVGRK